MSGTIVCFRNQRDRGEVGITDLEQLALEGRFVEAVNNMCLFFEQAYRRSPDLAASLERAVMTFERMCSEPSNPGPFTKRLLERFS